MSATRTWTPELPQAWVNAWRAQYLQNQGNGLLGGAGGSILSPLHTAEGTEHQRRLRFGPTWSWWRLSEEQKAAWWELG